MKMADFKEQLETIRLIAETIARQHNNHLGRDRQLEALRSLIECYMTNLTRVYAYTTEDWPIQKTTLQTIYDLCMPQVDNETHTSVKARIWLAVDVSNLALVRFNEQKYQAKRSYFEVRATEIVENAPDDFRPPSSVDDIPF